MGSGVVAVGMDMERRGEKMMGAAWPLRTSVAAADTV